MVFTPANPSKMRKIHSSKLYIPSKASHRLPSDLNIKALCYEQIAKFMLVLLEELSVNPSSLQ